MLFEINVFIPQLRMMHTAETKINFCLYHIICTRELNGYSAFILYLEYPYILNRKRRLLVSA